MSYAWLCRKPASESTIAHNVLRHGTGVLNIKASRIRSGEETECEKSAYQPNMKNQVYNKGFGGGEWQNTQGRWPANVILNGVRVGGVLSFKEIRHEA